MPQSPDALKYLAPNWFTIVMGLSGLSLADCVFSGRRAGRAAAADVQPSAKPVNVETKQVELDIALA